MGIQETLKALSDPVRRDILEHLKRGRLPAGQIAELFDISAPAVSRHLSVLKDAGLVRDYREGKFVFYELKASVLEETLLWMMNLKEAGDEEALRSHVHPDGA
ncbi:transcriptional regulator [Gordonibacter sp. An230]|uniref:autorepressor SdpR family transcription factor n=1 Tax=Gordonibacter sp. An230 TaxID=1965592 RepID=UPI000B368FE6|nr:autorepressor SdpR family transcription factor [Gordonibacter sp. An230]OUO90818.1 transcriptional regulator [Gordonibacter sp. An230]